MRSRRAQYKRLAVSEPFATRPTLALGTGRFTDTGTPDELLARPSLFKQLLESFEPDAKPDSKPA